MIQSEKKYKQDKNQKNKRKDKTETLFEEIMEGVLRRDYCRGETDRAKGLKEI